MSYSVYKLTAPNQKIYIGITSRDPKKRWNNGYGYIQNKHFYNAIQKYGWGNIKKEILYCGLSEEEAYSIEIKLISDLRTNESKFGYNKSFGGEKTVKGLHWKRTKESIQKSAEKRKGRKATEETKQKLSESLKKYYKNHDSYIKGKSLSEETKIKISNSLKKWNKEHASPNKGKTRKRENWEIEKVSRGHYKRIVCLETNIIYESIKQASELNKIDSSSLSKVCKGLRETAGGYHWRYQKDV